MNGRARPCADAEKVRLPVIHNLPRRKVMLNISPYDLTKARNDSGPR